MSILDQTGKELKRETIYVNHPLRYKGLTFYQTDWEIIGLRFQALNSEIYQIPIFKPTKNIWLSWLPTSSPIPQQSGYTVINTTLRGTSAIYNQNGNFLGEGEINEEFGFQNDIFLCDYITATGIQIKSDPGIPLIYIGFLLLLLSVISSYISYSQIWLTREKNKTLLGGMTNRSKIKFEFEMLNLVLQFQKV